MARWATLIEIAGVEFTGCRAEIVDAQPFLSSYAGSVDQANDGTPYPQVFNRGVKGIQFGVQFQNTESAKITDVFSAIQTAEGANTTFEVHIEDGLYDVNVHVVPDYSTQWFTHGKHSEGWYESALFRFITKALVV